MREKRDYILLTFQTTTHAMAMEKSCHKEGIPGRIIPLPAAISAGCGLSWRMLPDEYEEYESNLANLGIPFESVHKIKLYDLQHY